jgi:hypothetical protein
MKVSFRGLSGELEGYRGLLSHTKLSEVKRVSLECQRQQVLEQINTAAMPVGGTSIPSRNCLVMKLSAVRRNRQPHVDPLSLQTKIASSISRTIRTQKSTPFSTDVTDDRRSYLKNYN